MKKIYFVLLFFIFCYFFDQDKVLLAKEKNSSYHSIVIDSKGQYGLVHVNALSEKGKKENSIELWNLKKFSLEQTLDVTEDSINALSISPDGKQGIYESGGILLQR